MDFVYVTERGWRHIVWDFGSEDARHSFGLANESTRHVNSTNDFSPRVTTSNFVVWRPFLEYGRRKSVIFQRWAWLGQTNLVCRPIVAFGPFLQIAPNIFTQCRSHFFCCSIYSKWKKIWNALNRLVLEQLAKETS